MIQKLPTAVHKKVEISMRWLSYENATILENQSALKGVVELRAATPAEKSFALRECSSVLSLCSNQSVILPIHEAVTRNRV